MQRFGNPEWTEGWKTILCVNKSWPHIMVDARRFQNPKKHVLSLGCHHDSKGFTQILSHEELGHPSSSSAMYMNVNLEISGGTFDFYEGKFERLQHFSSQSCCQFTN